MYVKDIENLYIYVVTFEITKLPRTPYLISHYSHFNSPVYFKLVNKKLKKKKQEALN